VEEDTQVSDCLTPKEQNVASSVAFRLCMSTGSILRQVKHVLTPAKLVVRQHGK